jgi:transaldolase
MPDTGSVQTSATGNALKKLAAYGQSCWLDDLSRRMMTEGELSRFVAQGVCGVTANPATMARAITSGTDYDAGIQHAAAAGRSTSEIYDALLTSDVRRACDILGPVYEESRGEDGFVSLEVSPWLADDTGGSIAEAKRFWAAVDRPNQFIKIPGTAAGVPAVEELLFDEAVAEAYLNALERRIAANRPVAGISSVASFFLSRIDVLVDKLLESKADAHARDLSGKIAVANAKLAYQSMKRILASQRWETLRSHGVRAQRLLWASTSTKNPNYPDLMYVEPLIGPMTISTMPEQTIAAVLDHGNIVAGTIEQGMEEAREVMEHLDRLDIRFADVAARLEREGVQQFAQAFDKSIDPIRKNARL